MPGEGKEAGALADAPRAGAAGSPMNAKVVTNAVVTQKIHVSPELIVLRVAPDGWELPDFTPGQFGVLGLPGTAPRVPRADAEEPLQKPEKLIMRAYSIASSSRAKEYLEFYINLVLSGQLTPRLFQLERGDRVFLGKKITGMFTLEQVPEDKHLVLLGTGTGLAPYMSMLRTSFRCGEERKFVIIHGARHSWDLGYRAELTAMARMCGNLQYVTSITRPQEELVPWSGEIGYVQDLWARGLVRDALGFAPTPEDTHFFLCGNPGMVDSMQATLEAEGFVEHKTRAPGQIHTERYW
jgi:ferredoxin--NADP+ reductase